MSEFYIPEQYQLYEFLNPKQMTAILNISRSNCYRFLHQVADSKYPIFKVQRIGSLLRVQAQSFWAWYNAVDEPFPKGF